MKTAQYFKIAIYLLLVSTLFVSCSKDNDSSGLETASIVGIWKPILEVNVCKSGNLDAGVLSVCEQMSRMTVFSDGKVEFKQFNYGDDETEECNELNITGTWLINEDNFTLTLGGETTNWTFFELKEDTLRFGNYEIEDNFCDGESLVSYYYTQFIRVQQ